MFEAKKIKKDLFDALIVLYAFNTVLGLFEFSQPVEEKKLPEEKIQWIEKKILERSEARKNKDFKTADKIRDELLQEGIVLIDTPSGTKWEIKNS